MLRRRIKATSSAQPLGLSRGELCLQEPACSELIAELQMVQAWLPALASLDDDVDIDLAEGRVLGRSWQCRRSAAVQAAEARKRC